MKIKQLSIFVENKAGRLAKITNTLAEAKIDIRAISVADTTEFGILRLIVDDTRRAALALSDHGKIVDVTDVIGVEIPDTKGGLAELLKAISTENLGFDYLYAFVADDPDKAHVVLRIADNTLGEKILSSYGFQLLTEDDLK